MLEEINGHESHFWTLLEEEQKEENKRLTELTKEREALQLYQSELKEEIHYQRVMSSIRTDLGMAEQKWMAKKEVKPENRRHTENWFVQHLDMMVCDGQREKADGGMQRKQSLRYGCKREVFTRRTIAATAEQKRNKPSAEMAEFLALASAFWDEERAKASTDCNGKDIKMNGELEDQQERKKQLQCLLEWKTRRLDELIAKAEGQWNGTIIPTLRREAVQFCIDERLTLLSNTRIRNLFLSTKQLHARKQKNRADLEMKIKKNAEQSSLKMQSVVKDLKISLGLDYTPALFINNVM